MIRQLSWKREWHWQIKGGVIAAVSNTQRAGAPPCMLLLYVLALPASSDAHHTSSLLWSEYVEFPLAHSHGSD